MPRSSKSILPRDSGTVMASSRGKGAVMPKVVKVTPAQVNAAKLKIKRSAVSGKLVTSSVWRIANAKRASNSPDTRK